MPDSTRIYNSVISKERDRAEGVCFAGTGISECHALEARHNPSGKRELPSVRKARLSSNRKNLSQE